MDRRQVVADRTIALAAAAPRPGSTYRLQFHAGFTFRDATALVPYLRDLGITHVYASPYLQARAGSRHGYDIVDHRSLNRELGTDEDYLKWVDCLSSHGLSHLVDVVPNHMGIGTNDNVWWNDVLENGPASPYAHFFDIDWRSSLRPEFYDRVLLPILGESYGRALEAGQLQLAYDRGCFILNYFEHRFPIAPQSYVLVLGQRLELLGLPAEDADALEYQSIVTASRRLPARAGMSAEQQAEYLREKEVMKRRLLALSERSERIRQFIQENLDELNGRPGDPHSFDLLDRLLDQQAYRLAYWRVATDEINYRRFFDVNDLAALNMDRLDVFLAAHERILKELAAGHISGLRIDHPDGLRDPQTYLERLQDYYLLARIRTHPDGADGTDEEWLAAIRQSRARGDRCPLYVVIEKILAPAESLPAEWATDGTTGYEFLNAANGIFVDRENQAAFTRIYDQWLGEPKRYPEIAYREKFLILQVSLASELHVLARQVDRLAQERRASRDFTLNSLRHALRETVACFPVYRSYVTDQVHPDDRVHIEVAVRRARRKNAAIGGAVFDFVRDMLLLRYPENAGEESRQAQRRFVGMFQQLTAPVTAKGVEDTAFYQFNRLLSLNEVGGDPGRFGTSPEELHLFFRSRASAHPYALSASSTHDTKRGEEVRARLNVLSEMPEEWAAALGRWHHMNHIHCAAIEGEEVPEPNFEYFLYQTLLGAWPSSADSANHDFEGRIQAYMQKAAREAKSRTSWIHPDDEYEQALAAFIGKVLSRDNQPFLDDFGSFQKCIADAGYWNSLAQTLIKATAPGVPDFYQGGELWELSLVDPDNRRAIDYELRHEFLREICRALAGPSAERRAYLQTIWHHRADGRVKALVISAALACRKADPALFSAGEYLPGRVTGERSEHVFAFARQNGSATAVTIVPRLPYRLLHASPNAEDAHGVNWADTRVAFSGLAPNRGLVNAVTGQTAQFDTDGMLSVGRELKDFPVALLIAESAA